MGNCNYDFNIVHTQCTYFVSLIFYSLLKMCAKDLIGNKLSHFMGYPRQSIHHFWGINTFV